MADINVKFDTGGGTTGDGSSNQFLVGVLQKLNATLEKLGTISNRASQVNQPVSAINSIQSLDDAKRRYKQDTDTMMGEFRNVGNKIGNMIGASILTGIGVTAVRAANNYSAAVIGRAGAQGVFAASGIAGNANQAASGFIGQLYDVERARRIEQNSLLAQGAGGTAGAAAGAIVGGVGGAIAGIRGGLTGAASGASKGAGAGAGLGGALGYAGATVAVAKSNAEIERDFLMQSALAQRNMNASISQWKTGFSRFGLSMSSTQIVPSDITGGAAINAPLSSAFQNRFGKSQNFNGILNGIVPNLNTNPLDTKATGDLDKVAQNFLKAGFAAEDFSKLTIQSSQYTAATGKNIEAFSEDVKSARAKFGDAFDTASLQTSLNLMSLGYNKDTAQSIAYQSQFNQGVAGNVSRYANQGFSDFYRNQALSKSFGFNVNESLRTGQFAGGSDARRKQLTSEIENYFDKGIMSSDLGKITATGTFTPASLKSLLQNKVPTTSGYNGESQDSSASPGQQLAQEVMTAITDGIKNVQNMNVTAQNVTISNQTGAFTPANAISTAIRNIIPPPSAQVGGRSPAGK